MNYELEFHEDALKEWNKLDASVKEQFKKHLARRLAAPHVPSARLRDPGMANTYKIKLRELGYRLVYEVNEQSVTVVVLSVGKRERNSAYRMAELRIAKKR